MEDIQINLSDPRAVRVILGWPRSDPRPIYLGALLQQLHLQPVAVLKFLTAMTDYMASRGSVLETRIEGWGSIGDLSPAPPHRQQVAAEPPPPPPTRVCTARATPTPETPPSPPNSTQTQTQTPTPPEAVTQEHPQTTPPKKEEAPGGVLQRGVVQQLLNGLLLGVHHRLLGVRGVPTPHPGQGAQPPQPPSQGSRGPPPPTQVEGQAKGKRGGGCKYKAGEQVYVVFRDNGEWGIEQGKEALAAGAPPGVGETWISFPKDPKLFAVPRVSVWKTKTRAKKFLAKMMAAEEKDKEDDADVDEENDGDEGNDGDGNGGDEWNGPGAGLGATGANRDAGVEEEVEGVEGERMGVEGVEGEGVVGEGVEGEGVVCEGVEGEGVMVGEGDGGDSGAGDKSSGAPAGPPTTHDF